MYGSLFLCICVIALFDFSRILLMPAFHVEHQRFLKLFIFLYFSTHHCPHTSTSAAQSRPAASESCRIATHTHTHTCTHTRTHSQGNVCDTDVSLMDDMGQLLTSSGGNPGLLSPPLPLISSVPLSTLSISLLSLCLFAPAGQGEAPFLQVRR